MFRVFIVLLLGLSMVCALWVHSHFAGWGVFEVDPNRWTVIVVE